MRCGWNHLNRNLVSNRKPLDERLHDRDLEAALTLSLLNSSNERNDQSKGDGLSLQNKKTNTVVWCRILQLQFLFFIFIFQGLPKFKLWQMKTQTQRLCTSPTAVWTVQFWVSSVFVCFFTVYTERLLIFLQETLLDLLFCVEGLDEISAEKETLVKERKAAAKAAAESRKALKDEDEDYEPKASPGCLLALTVYLLLPFWCQ